MRFFTLLLLVFLCSAPLSVSAVERRTPIVTAVAKAGPAVVNIRTEQIVQRRSSPYFGFGDSLFDQFFQDMMAPRSYKTQSLGSGVIIDPDGHILTNAHVVDKASKIYVALTGNDRELEAQLVGQDERVDLAVLKIVDKGQYPFLVPGRSDDLLLGETVIAIGNPLGLGHSITTGIVSSLNRRIQISSQLSSLFIQTDALINPGNSGGPLININGELIGINTAIAKQAQGIGFSIPIDTARRVVEDLITFGRVRHGFLGVLAADVSARLISSYGTGGALVEGFLPGSPAFKAGIQVADVILAIDGVAVASNDQYLSLIQTYTPGDRVRINLLRGERKMETEVVLTALPSGFEQSYARQIFGFSLNEDVDGLILSEVVKGSAAERVGLARGDRLVKLEDEAVRNLEEFSRAVEDRIGRKPLTFTIVRDKYAYLVNLP